MQDDAKPVAWMYERERSEVASAATVINIGRLSKEQGRGWTETPLYAHPPAPAQPAPPEIAALIYSSMDKDFDRRAALAAMPVGEPVQELLELSADAVDRQEAADKAATFCIEQLASMLGDPDYVQADGSEEWEGDVSGTIYNVLVAAKIIDDEDGSVASHATPPADADAGLVAKIIHDTLENDDDSDGGGYMRAANAVLAALGQGGVR